MSANLPAADSNRWPVIPNLQRDELPIVVSDLDGTLRGDVGPMVKLAGLLVPKFIRKVLRREPLRAGKVLWFLLGLGRLWTLRTINREHRRRYKYLFSELHTLAATLLSGTETSQLRELYQQSLPHMAGLWYPEAIELLRRLTRTSRVILITGSEQIQTEECVRLLAQRGVDISRIHVHGSLYTVNPQTRRFTGAVTHLNVTLDGKRESLLDYTAIEPTPFAAALGNSRPDRALFEAVVPDGLRVLVCRSSVVRKRKRSAFVIRKLVRSGFPVLWFAEDYLAEIRSMPAESGKGCPTEPAPQCVLTTDREFDQLAESGEIARHFGFLSDAACDETSAADLLNRSRRRPELPMPNRLPDHLAPPSASHASDTSLSGQN